MSSKQITKKRGVVACNKCKRDKKKCDGSYLTQKPCKNCRDRNERCEYIEPSRLKANEMINNISSNISNIEDIQYQDFPLRQNLDKSNIILQLLTDPSTTNEQTIILKRLYNEITRNPENPNFIGNKRDELFMKLKLLSSSSSSSSSTDNNDHTKIQIWNDLCSLVNELDNNLDSILNTWNSEPLEFSSSSSPIITNNNLITPPNDQLNVKKTTTTITTIRDKPPKVRVIKGNKKTNDIKKRKSRKNQRENKRTQPYPAGGQIVIRPSKQAHTMIWHQNDPIDDVPIMAFQIQHPITPPTPPPVVNRPQQRTQFQQQPLPSFPHFQSVIPINLWDHSTTTMTMLSPKPSPTFSESEINNNEPTTNSILLSPTPSLHDDIGDIVSSPSNSSIDHTRVISDDEKERFGLISLTSTTTGSPQSPSLFTVEEFIEMWSNSSSVTDDLSVVEPIWNC
ncbi:unnamed protein product [Rhizophagus irregularis]|uniref:Zn(2)-C6 fungal-type domain-containing protein n=1 Tax=Rhizophagus irregularis TaxID=588596 RepID=A0A2I1G0B5_9GLOM|nr:hypothetical protein RhiirA4_394178 [Rhizophagus irregularis]CAB4411057.1 unnamed protein product [Rhizophagus irregularis]CAB4411534.1 unnamed protein product [Rhizophagus irregularis]